MVNSYVKSGKFIKYQVSSNLYVKSCKNQKKAKKKHHFHMKKGQKKHIPRSSSQVLVLAVPKNGIFRIFEVILSHFSHFEVIFRILRSFFSNF
jgi:hypothetical protein